MENRLVGKLSFVDAPFPRSTRAAFSFRAETQSLMPCSKAWAPAKKVRLRDLA